MKSVPLKKLTSFLDRELSLSEFPKDESANGLQVEGRGTVSSVGIAVDACDFVFRQAAQQEIDFLLVHHGLIWGGLRAITGTAKKRILYLLRGDISLYGCHLPLDWHPSYGNNVQLLKLLHLKKMGAFGEYHGKRIGYWGRLRSSLTLRQFVSQVNKTLNAESRAISFGKKVRNVGVVSGGGWSAVMDAEHFDIDTFLTGEPSHSAYALAEEMKVNLIFAGHYATETPGVRAAGQMICRKFGLPVKFIDHPTGL